jgi:hypothetical protein
MSLNTVNFKNNIRTSGYVNITEIATPSTPSVGNQLLYTKTDKKIYTLDSDGLEFALSSPETSSTGLISGGLLSVGTGGPGISTTFNLSMGTGTVVTALPYGSPIITSKPVTWSTFTDVTITGGIASRPFTYVSIDASGSIVQSASVLTNVESRTLIGIGIVLHINLATVNDAGSEPNNVTQPMSHIRDMANAIGSLNIEGNLLFGHDTDGVLTFGKTVGTMYALNKNFVANSNNPSSISLAAVDTLIGTGINRFRYAFQDGSLSVFLTEITPNILDIGTPYPGSTYANNRYGLNYIYIASNGIIVVHASQNDYSSMANAIDAINIDTFVISQAVKNNLMLIGYLVIQGNTNNLTDTVDAQFINASKFGAASATTATTDLQTAYENSVVPQIITNSSNGAFELQRGSLADTDNMLVIRNNNSDVVFGISAVGNITTLGEMKVGENHIELNHGYTTIAEKEAGLVVNYLPTATNDTVNGNFTAGDPGVSNPTVITTGSDTFANNVFIQLYNSLESDNTGIFEVLNHTGTLLTVRGVGLTDIVTGFTQRQFVTDISTPTGTITAVNISVMASNSGGVWATGKGLDNTLTLNNVVDVSLAVNTSITGTGALGAGSITSGFGSIDNGASAITTTGSVSSGSLSVTGTSNLIGVTTMGTGGTNYTLPITRGTDTQVLITNGSGVVSWGNAGAVPVYTRTVVSAVGPYFILVTDEIIGIDTSSNVVTVTLPQITSLGTTNNYKKYNIVDEGGNATNNNITLATTGGDTINKAASPLLISNNNDAISLYSDGSSNWVIY